SPLGGGIGGSPRGGQHPATVRPSTATICGRTLRCTLDPLLRDAIDEQIVALLVENARASFHEIGSRVGLSAPAVKRRVDRLQRSGVIVGYTAVVDPGAVGHETEAFVELWCRSRTSPREIEAMLA